MEPALHRGICQLAWAQPVRGPAGVPAETRSPRVLVVLERAMRVSGPLGTLYYGVVGRCNDLLPALDCDRNYVRPLKGDQAGSDNG